MDHVTQQCPPMIIEQYGDIMLSADVMHVNGVPFFVTRSHHIHFGTVDVLPSLQATDIGTALRHVVNIYACGGFQVTTALMDGAFASLHDVCNQLQVTLNTTSRDEHVGDMERYIRTIKERMRGITNTLPFKRLPRNMIIELGKAAVYWLNSVPSPMGVSSTISPRTIITGQVLDYHKHCRYEFGEYVQTHEEHDNSLLSRTVGAIALRPTGNQQGGYFFMSLHTSRVINRLHATKLPMPAEVITRVDQLAKTQNMLPALAFGNRDNRLIMQDITDDTESEDAYIPVSEADSTMYYDTDVSMTNDEEGEGNTPDHNEQVNNIPHRNIPTDMIQANDSLTVSTITNDDMTQLPMPTATVNNQLSILSEADEEEDQDEVSQISEHNTESTPSTSQGENKQMNGEPTSDDTNVGVGTSLNEKMDAKYGSRSTRWNLRQQKQRTYDHKHDENAEIYVAQSTDATMATPQMPICHGLKLFGTAGVNAVKAELQQLHNLKVMGAKPLSPTQKQEALGYLMFLK